MPATAPILPWNAEDASTRHASVFCRLGRGYLKYLSHANNARTASVTNFAFRYTIERMKTYRAYMDFTAQSQAVAALMSMYAQIERGPSQVVNFLPVVVFQAFSIEAYLNSLGSRKLVIWDELERLSWEKKMQILHKIAGKKLDRGRDPLQFAYEVFKLRDRLAHGKSERVLGSVFTNRREAEAFYSDHQKSKLEPDWYKQITKEWIVDTKERFRLLMTYLGALFSLHESDHLLQGSGGFLIDDGE